MRKVREGQGVTFVGGDLRRGNQNLRATVTRVDEEQPGCVDLEIQLPDGGTTTASHVPYHGEGRPGHWKEARSRQAESRRTKVVEGLDTK